MKDKLHFKIGKILHQKINNTIKIQKMQSKKIIVALDSNNFSEIEKLVKSLKKEVYAFKIDINF